MVASPLDEVLEALQALLDARRDTAVPAQAGHGNFRCERCVDCSHCRFCTDCTACEDCTYCEGCSACTSCTHCKHCLRCKQTTHSSWSCECDDSSYLTLCLDCESCVQCFACVGLQHEEFCVLNEKLPRKAYFSRVAALRGALEERLAAGWRPPWEPAVAAAEASAQEALVEPAPEPVSPEPQTHEAERTPLRVEQPGPAREVVPMPGSSERSLLTRPEPKWREEERSAPSMASPVRRERSEITADIIEPKSAARPPRATPPWSFADVRRGRNPPTIEEGDQIPEPPPFGSGPHPAAEAPAEPAASSGEPRASDEPTHRKQALPRDPPRDRYGWSAQAEGTPVRLGWSVQAEGEPERLSWSTAADDEPVRRPESPASRWGSVDEGSGRWSRPRDEPEDRAPLRKAWDQPPDRPQEPSEYESDRRRRETAASPSATPLGPEDLPIVHGRDRLVEREPDARSVYDAARRSRLGPDERTEPDAPIPRRSSSRAELSGFARGSGDLEDPARRSETRATPSAENEQAEPRSTYRSLGVARRPERPRAPEPRERGGALLRGRAPARPAPPAPARQPDAPSLRRARRPSRTRDELPTSEYLAVDEPGDDPERS